MKKKTTREISKFLRDDVCQVLVTGNMILEGKEQNNKLLGIYSDEVKRIVKELLELSYELE